MVKAVLPGMRARRAGTIVNISSIGARACPPGSGYYSATKAAMEAMEVLISALRKEVEPLGITVFAVEPGAFRTDFASRSLTQSAEATADTRPRLRRPDRFGPAHRRRAVRRRLGAPGAVPRDRSMITVTSLIISGSTEQLRGHLQRALDNGVSETELKEVVTHMAFYAGWPKAMSAIGVAKEVFGA